MEPVLWLLSPFAAAAAAALVLHVRSRPASPEHRQRVRRRQLQRIESALRGDRADGGGAP